MRLILPLIAAGMTLGLAACGNSSNEATASPAQAATGEVEGVSYDVLLSAELDGEDISFTVHEPDTLVNGASYPLVLHSHGYGGARQAARPSGGLLSDLLANGYGVLSVDERGHNQAGGTIRILDPTKEGQDWLQILDWAEAELAWLAYDDGNPIIGATGGSYGGGFQHLVYALDAKHRLDAIAPDITWHDLRYSLFSGGVFKSMWATLLSAVGNNPAANNRQDAEVNEGLTQGQTTNNLDDDKLALLYQNSLRSHCEGNNATTAPGGLQPIDAFITQSHLDTLFNFNDAYHNFECLRALGGDVRLFTKATGHGLDNGDGGQNCGALERDAATLAWFDEKLKGRVGAADSIPQICLNLGSEGADAVTPTTITVGGSSFAIDQQTITVGEGNPNIVYVPLYTAPADGDVLAGIPTIQLTLADPITGAENPALDPILFIGLGLQAAGGSAPTSSLMNQVRPFRGYGQFDEELVGVMTRMSEGDQIVLMLHASHSQQYPGSGSLTPATLLVDANVALPLLGPTPPTP